MQDQPEMLTLLWTVAAHVLCGGAPLAGQLEALSGNLAPLHAWPLMPLQHNKRLPVGLRFCIFTPPLAPQDSSQPAGNPAARLVDVADCGVSARSMADKSCWHAIAVLQECSRLACPTLHQQGWLCSRCGSRARRAAGACSPTSSRAPAEGPLGMAAAHG